MRDSGAALSARPRSVLFLPGAGGDGTFWKGVGDLFPAGWTKTYLSWPGLGNQLGRPDIRGFDDLVRLTEDSLGAPSVLVAQSMGGIVGIELSFRHPGLVTHLVLTATSGGLDVGEEWPVNLLSWHKDKSGVIRIAINPVSAAAIIGKHVRIDLRERVMLKGDYAKIGHAWLCGWISPGRNAKISTNKLAINIWGEESEPGTGEFRKRKMKVRYLMHQLKEIGWEISEEAPNLFEISRPKGEGIGTQR